MDLWEIVAAAGGTVIWWIIIIGIIAAVVSRMKKGVRGPSLVLTHWSINRQPDGGNYVEATGRAEGLVGWLLTTLKLGATTTLMASEREVSMSVASLSGQIHQSAPHRSVASTTCGMSKPTGLLVLAVMCFIGVIPGLLSGIVPGIIALILSVVFAVYYFLSKKMFLMVTFVGGAVIGMKFKKSMIEGVAVDIDALREGCAMINWLATRPAP
jgi:hypothetical protein